jgi:hypothetical protein
MPSEATPPGRSGLHVVVPHKDASPWIEAVRVMMPSSGVRVLVCTPFYEARFVAPTTTVMPPRLSPAATAVSMRNPIFLPSPTISGRE